MKIAMLIDGREPIFGWGQVHVKYLSELLVQNHGCQVDVFVRKLIWDDGKKYTKDEIWLDGKYRLFRVGPSARFFNVFGRILALVSTTCYLFYKAITEKYDLIHAHAYVSGLPAKIVWFLTHTPVVYTVHGTMGLDANKKWLLAKLERWLVCGISYSLEISVSHKIFEYKNVNKNIKIIHNGVDLSQYDAINVDKKYPWVTLIYVGRFDWQKGIEYLIEAVHLLDKALLNEKGFVINIVGDGELKNDYLELIKQYHLEKYFIFKGKLFWNDLIQEYKKNQIFILPSLAEGQPLTLLEAYASGLPALVTDVGDNRYFVKEGENWWMVPAGDEKVLANCIQLVLTGDFRIGDLGKNGYKMVQKSYTWDIVVQNTYDEYKKLIKR